MQAGGEFAFGLKTEVKRAGFLFRGAAKIL
jgi:hypothetical protein